MEAAARRSGMIFRPKVARAIEQGVSTIGKLIVNSRIVPLAPMKLRRRTIACMAATVIPAKRDGKSSRVGPAMDGR